MKAVIVDDEKGSIEILQQKIIEFVEGVSIAATFSDPHVALPYLQKGEFDILFLDVDMPGMNGFELIDKIDEVKFEIVFTTAYSQFAIEAIRVGAFDYLTKPILIDDLQKCISRLKNFITPKINTENLVFDKINNQSEKILISTNEAFEYVLIENIILVKAESNYSNVVLKTNKSILVSKTLGEFEEQLQKFGFIRTHHSYLVNIKHITRFIKEDGGYIIASNDTKASVSRRKKDELLALLKMYSV
jgi:two-component system, LytTR family, response regulator